MDLKRLRFPVDRQQSGPTLFWCFDYSTESRNKENFIYNQPLSILDDLASTDHIDMLPDPTVHVIGVHFERAEAESLDRSLSPNSLSKSKARKEDEADSYVHTPRTAHMPNTTRETSAEPLVLKDKAGSYAKEKNKGTLVSLTTKYSRTKGTLGSRRRGLFERGPAQGEQARPVCLAHRARQREQSLAEQHQQPQQVQPQPLLRPPRLGAGQARPGQRQRQGLPGPGRPLRHALLRAQAPRERPGLRPGQRLLARRALRARQEAARRQRAGRLEPLHPRRSSQAQRRLCRAGPQGQEVDPWPLAAR